MNEQALIHSFELFRKDGYNGTIEEYKRLIASDKEAFDYSYKLFVNDGYSDGVEDYKNILGLGVQPKQTAPVKKKEQTTGMESNLAGSSLVSNIFEPQEPEPKLQPQPVTAPSLFPEKKQPTVTTKMPEPYAPIPVEEKETPFKGFPKTWEEKKGPLPTQVPIEKGTYVSDYKREPEKQGYIFNLLSSLEKGVGYGVGTGIKGLGTYMKGVEEGVRGGKAQAYAARLQNPVNPTPYLADILIKIGDKWNDAITYMTPQDEEFKNSLSDQVGQALGDVAQQALTAYVTGGGSLGMKSATKVAPITRAEVLSNVSKEFFSNLTNPAAISSGLRMGQSEFDRAKEAGATDEQAFEAFYKNAAVGSVLEQLPVMDFLKRFNKASVGGISDYLKTKAVGGITGGLEEMSTEVLQQLYANKTAQEIYNTNQDLFEGVAESGGIGFGVGFLLNAIGANAKIVRGKGDEQLANMLEAQLAELQNRLENGGPSEYKLNGIKVGRDAVSAMLDNMTASELNASNIEIINDDELKTRLQDKIVISSIEEQVREANPELNDTSIRAIAQLERELQGLETNKTQTGKDKAAALRQQIKDIQENPLQEEAAADVASAETAARITEIEQALSPDAETQVSDEDRVKLEAELQTLKQKQDAIQKQGAAQGVLGGKQPEVGLQQVGEGDKGPQVTAEGTEETITPEAKKKAVEDLEAKRREELDRGIGTTIEETGRIYQEYGITPEERADINTLEKTLAERINQKYDKELASLNAKPVSEQVATQPTTLTQEEQLARMEEMFAEGEIPSAPAADNGVSVTNKSALNEVKNRANDIKKSSIVDNAVKVLNTLKSVLPDFDIVVHDDDGSYASAMQSVNGNTQSAGNFSYVRNADGSYSGRIDINLNRANNRTVAHEVTHGILLKAFGENPELFKDFKARVQTLLSESANKTLVDFASQYADVDYHEEYLAELVATLSEQEANLSPTFLQKIATLINEFVSNITGGKVVPFTDTRDTKQVMDFFNSISQSIQKGEAIKAEAAKPVLGKAEARSKAQLPAEGTGIKLQGTENVVKGRNLPTVTTNKGYQDDYSFDEILKSTHAPNSRVITLALNIANGEMSYTKKGQKQTFKLPYINKSASNKIKSLRQQYRDVKGSSKESKEKKQKIAKEINTVSKKVLSEFTNTMTLNLLALYDTLDPKFVQSSKDWYVGANRIANSIASNYNLTEEQASGIIAVLSPQNDWFNNVSVAERVIDVMSKNADTKFDKDVLDKAVSYNTKNGEPNDFAIDLMDMFNQYGGMSINDMQKNGVSVLTQASLLRAIDQALNSPKVAVTDPEGKFIGYDKTPVRWNSVAEISKAINVFRNGDIENINENLGDGNKVRNFYNNIVDPNSETPYVTADTHALSASLNAPMSANDAGGFGLFNGSLEPAYSMVKQAYIDAANVAGIKPREMQSITWEAQRVGINDKNRTEEKKKEVFDYLSQSRKNNQTAYERATELIARVRSSNPEWGKPRGIETQISTDSIRKGAELRSKQRISQLHSLRGKSGAGTTGAKLDEGAAGRRAVPKSGVKSKAQIIGQNAQLSATVKNNLELAKEMSDYKMPPISIKRATGWEKGRDGKWRYEVEYGNYKDFDVNDLKQEKIPVQVIKNNRYVEELVNARVAKLGDIFDAPDLYNAYPDVKNMEIAFYEMPMNTWGSFNRGYNRLNINQKLHDAKPAESALTVIHEIQHYIQGVELFEKGSNTAIAKYNMDALVKKTRDNAAIANFQYKSAKTNEPNNKALIQQRKKELESAKLIRDKIISLRQQKMFKSEKEEINQILKAYEDLTGKSYKENAELVALAGLDNPKEADAFNLYQRVAGEVEARNAEHRSKLDAKTRRQLLLSETEDVDREDQILFDNINVIENEAGETMKESFPVSKSQLADDKKVTKLVKDARAQGFSEEAISTFLKGKGLSEQQITDAMSPEVAAAGKVKLSEELFEGHDALMDSVDDMIKQGKSLRDVVRYIKNAKQYMNATDVQKEQFIRDLRKKFGLREKSSPLVSRILGVIEKKITMTEKSLLVKQIKDLSRGAKDMKTAWKKANEDVSAAVKQMIGKGTLTTKQASSILKKFSKVNMLSDKSIGKFLDYANKIFKDAEYDFKLSKANSLKKDIKKLSKNKDKNANLKALGAQFSKIDPSMIEDIDEYNKIASSVKKAIDGSTIKGMDVRFAETVDINEVYEYVTKTLNAQKEAIRKELADEIQEMMGVDVSDLSYSDLLLFLENKASIPKKEVGIIRSTIQKAFDVYASIIKETVDSGIDQFTGEDVSFTKTEKDMITQFMGMDLSILSPREALKAVDSLNNFIVNHSVAGMISTLADYNGKLNAIEVRKKNIRAKKIQKLYSGPAGRFLVEYTYNLTLMFDRMFKGMARGGYVEKMMGLTDMINGKTAAQAESNRIAQTYVDIFFDKNVNGEKFNSEYNNVERGMLAYMSRTVVGTTEEQEIEFNRRKQLIKETMDALSNGSELEQKKAELYKKAYDKLLKDSFNIYDVKSNAPDINNLAVEWWQKQWSDRYERMSEISEGVYNKELGSDVNYTPDRMSRLQSNTENVQLSNDESSFHYHNGTLYKKSAGVLMTPVGLTSLPTFDNGKVKSFVDLSFDKNNANAMYAALVDINTAEYIRQAESFMNSKDFDVIVPNSDDAKLLKSRVDMYVSNIRNKTHYDNDELSNIVRKLNKLASFGASQVLGGPTQTLKQVIPVAFNTLMTAGRLDINSIFNADKMKFIDNSGYGVSIRGIESQAQIESINKIVETAAKSSPEKAAKFLEKANNMWLELFLVKPDVFIARVSWMSFYEQALKKQGIDPSGIDYSTHKLNKEAADYAQRMLDRQQNVSDADLAGKAFSSKDSSSQILRKMLLAFSSFRMNQSARLGTDLSIITDKTSTYEDKLTAYRSLSGYVVENAMFRLVSASIGVALGSLAYRMLDKEEDDEEFEKRIDNTVKGQLTGVTTDFFSPVPFLDKAAQSGIYNTLDIIQEYNDVPKDDRANIYDVSKQSLTQNLGMYGLSAERLLQLKELSTLASKGTYISNYGKETTISDKDKEALGYLIAPAVMTNVGLLPTEFNSVIRNAIKFSKLKEKDEQKEYEKEQKRMRAEESKQEKIDALEESKKFAVTQKDIDAIDDMIYKLKAATKEQWVLLDVPSDEIREQSKEEREWKESLLIDRATGKKYDNVSDLKRYNKRLYNKNFGPRSEWAQEHESEVKAAKKMREVMRKEKDKEYGYRAPERKSNRKNSDGSVKRSYRSSFSRSYRRSPNE